MVAPFLDLLFLKNDSEYAEQLADGPPELNISVESAIDNFYYFFTSLIMDPDKGKLYALSFICVMVVFMFFMKNLFRYLAMFFLAPVRNGVVKDLRNSLHDKVARLPLGFHTEERKGDIIARMTTDVQEIEWSVMSSLEATFRDPISIVIFLITMIIISPSLSLFVFVLLPITAFIITRIGKSLKRTSANSKTKLGQLMSMMDETLSGLRIIKAFNAEDINQNKFKHLNKQYTVIMNRLYRKTDLSSPLSEFLGAGVLVVIMYFGGLLVLSETESLTAAMFITYVAIFSQLIPPSKSFTNAFYNIQKGIASADRIYDILDAENNIKDKANAKDIEQFKDRIEYRDVSFSYVRNDSGYVLRDINVIIPKGKSIALVGQSGSGKTTMADMLPRFYDSTHGQILIDGIPLKELKVRSVRNLMGIVSQESILFNDTVFNNISFGMKDVELDDVINAAKIANAHEFIDKLDGKYEFQIGDRGGKLSGGQRQRLSIARAVLKNPPILILDEATSALDTESERLVQDALSKLMQNRTTLVIAHRLSTIQYADEILVLNQGVIEERGNHDELIRKKGLYKKLFDLQSFS
jgi:ABC-type multidrug transport system fused ATPase/permease subunit